jgi:hypothetical protein
MNQGRSQIVYVNIGVSFSSIPIMQKVMVSFDPNMWNAVEAANNLRRMVAQNIEQFGYDRGENFDHTALYYEIYGDVNNTVPFAMSFNSRYRKEHADGRIT